MTKLSVNVNKLATLRNSRGTNNPNVLTMTLDIIEFGAEGITVHPRPDGRHIRTNDVFAIAEAIDVDFNIEGYPSAEFLNLVQQVKPTQCTLVPDAPDVLTSNAGWAVEQNSRFLQNTVALLHDVGVRTSLFIDPFHFSADDLKHLVLTQTDRVELYTEAYATRYKKPDYRNVLSQYQQVGASIQQHNIALNAGHDLNLDNLNAFIHAVPNINEVSIGHALICDALYYGMDETIQRYLQCLR